MSESNRPHTAGRPSALRRRENNREETVDVGADPLESAGDIKILERRSGKRISEIGQRHRAGAGNILNWRGDNVHVEAQTTAPESCIGANELKSTETKYAENDTSEIAISKREPRNVVDEDDEKEGDADPVADSFQVKAITASDSETKFAFRNIYIDTPFEDAGDVHSTRTLEVKKTRSMDPFPGKRIARLLANEANMSSMIRDRLNSVRFMRSLWQAGDLCGLCLYLLNVGNEAHTVDFLQQLKSRTIRDAPDPFVLAEALVPVAERLLSSRFENYVDVALGALQCVVAEIGPTCARILAKADADACAVVTSDVLKINPVLSDLSRVRGSLKKLSARGDCPSSIERRCDSILRRIDAIWRLGD